MYPNEYYWNLIWIDRIPLLICTFLSRIFTIQIVVVVESITCAIRVPRLAHSIIGNWAVNSLVMVNGYTDIRFCLIWIDLLLLVAIVRLKHFYIGSWFNDGLEKIEVVLGQPAVFLGLMTAILVAGGTKLVQGIGVQIYASLFICIERDQKYGRG